MSAPKYSRVECIDVTREQARVVAHLGADNSYARSLVHHLTPRAPFADVRVTVGDLVRVGQPAFRTSPARLTQHAYRVQEVCPWRGVLVEGYWHRSWVRVKGGAA